MDGSRRLGLLAPLGLVLGLLATVLLPPAPALACTCAPFVTPELSYEWSASVFRGRVATMESSRDTSFGFRVTFDATMVWKGGLARRIVVYTGENEAECGYPFEVGGDYLVFAVLEPDLIRGGSRVLTTNYCLSTGPYDEEAARWLGPGRDPTSMIGALFLPAVLRFVP